MLRISLLSSIIFGKDSEKIRKLVLIVTTSEWWRTVSISTLVSKDVTLDLWRRHVITETGQRSIFKESVRLKVLDSLIQSKLVIRKLMARGYIKDYFPLHNTWFKDGEMRFTPGEDGHPPTTEDAKKEEAYDPDEHASAKKGLAYRWKYRCCNPFYNPANKIRTYFGEKIAL